MHCLKVQSLHKFVHFVSKDQNNSGQLSLWKSLKHEMHMFILHCSHSVFVSFLIPDLEQCLQVLRFPKSFGHCRSPCAALFPTASRFFFLDRLQEVDGLASVCSQAVFFVLFVQSVFSVCDFRTLSWEWTKNRSLRPPETRRHFHHLEAFLAMLYVAQSWSALSTPFIFWV